MCSKCYVIIFTIYGRNMQRYTHHNKKNHPMKKLSINLFHPENQLYKIKKVKKRMRQLVCKKLRNVWCFLFQFLISVPMDRKSTKKLKIVFIGLFRALSKRRQLFMQKHFCGLFRSLLRKGTPLSKTTNKVEFVNLKNLHFVIIFYLLHNSETSLLLRTTSSFVWLCVDAHNLQPV